MSAKPTAVHSAVSNTRQAVKDVYRFTTSFLEAVAVQTIPVI